jgi:hypothetical protein
VLVPRHASARLLERSLELLGEARIRFPNASFHHVRLGVHLYRLDRGRHLLAKLREVVGGHEVGPFDGAGTLLRGGFRGSRRWVLTVRKTEQGLEWVRVWVNGPPRVERTGDLENVLTSFAEDRNPPIFFLRPRGAPEGLAGELLAACRSKADPGATVMVYHGKSRDLRWGADLDDDALAPLYPLRMSEVIEGPLHVTGIVGVPGPR